jgi:hypothetical protein
MMAPELAGKGAPIPAGYVIVGTRTVRGPDGREYDALDAIRALPWTAQLCPLMRHEYSIWKQGPEWAWNVLSSMLLAQNPDSFRAYFRGYQSANRYWDAPDGLRYWRGRFEIDRGQPDGVGQRRAADGGRPRKDWDGPPHAPDGIGLYDRDDQGKWWPTEAALSSGYQPCASCSLMQRKSTIVATPEDPQRIAALIATAETECQSTRGRPLTRDELGRVLREYEDRALGPFSQMRELHGVPEASSSNEVNKELSRPAHAADTVSKDRVVQKLLELRAREAPLGSTGYRGVLTQKTIADVADVRVQDVTRAAIELDREMNSGSTTKAE